MSKDGTGQNMDRDCSLFFLSVLVAAERSEAANQYVPAAGRKHYRIPDVL